MWQIGRTLWIGVAGILFMVGLAAAHCEIPCGIYDDEMRFRMIREHITTIEKSMRQITAIEQTKPVNSNQLVRWVVNKEDHANQLQEIVSQYFLTQRIVPEDKSYPEMLAALHQLLTSAMRCKQTVDLKHVVALKEQVAAFETLYFKDRQHAH